MIRPVDVLLDHLETLRQAFANGQTRVCAVHIGRTWDEAKARERISRVMGDSE